MVRRHSNASAAPTIDASSESHPPLFQIQLSSYQHLPQDHVQRRQMRDMRHHNQCHQHHHHCNHHTRNILNGVNLEDEDSRMHIVPEGSQPVADWATLHAGADLDPTQATGFGDISRTLQGSRTRASRSGSDHVEEIIGEISTNLSQLFSANCNIGNDRVRRSR
jgi:hypothetical protein